MIKQDELRSHLRPAAVVAAAVAASLVLYLVLVEVLRAVYRPFRGFAAVGDVQTLRYAVFGAAVAVVILIRVLRPRLLRLPPGADGRTVLARLQRVSILTLVLAEVPAILGLGHFLVTGHNVDFYVLLAASLLLVFMYFPRQAAWEEGGVR